MKLDRSFASELRRVLNGDGSREYRISLGSELRQIKTQLESKRDFAGAVRQYGREKVLACVAATIYIEWPDFEKIQREWASQVIGLWANRHASSVSGAAINMHPAILMDKTFEFRKLTIDSWD